ncbi:hypothetical protein ACIBF6_36280 [Streptosporangium amethystogenes]|uniref:hypothetical protein n=1 Tax=Streptosporangium amethystogenes TaxID=2002 RepID=UPI003799F96D
MPWRKKQMDGPIVLVVDIAGLQSAPRPSPADVGREWSPPVDVDPDSEETASRSTLENGTFAVPIFGRHPLPAGAQAQATQAATCSTSSQAPWTTSTSAADACGPARSAIGMDRRITWPPCGRELLRERKADI